MKLQLCVFKKYKVLTPKKICKKNKKSSIKIGFIKNYIYHINIIFIRWYILIILKKQNYITSKGLTRIIYNMIESFL